MGSTNFRPFAKTDTGDNLLSDTEFATLYPTGHQPGIADDRLANKAAKQASLMATAIAEFVAVRVEPDVLDTLTPEELAALFVEAVATVGGIALATTDAPGIVQLATGDEVNAGNAGDRAVTPAALVARTATQSRTGLIRTASSSEAQAAAADAITTKAVTPKALADRTALESRTGVVALATIAEAIAGANTTKAVTPAGLAGALASIFDADLSSPGWYQFPFGLLIQWGTSTTTGEPHVDFPVVFPGSVFAVMVTPFQATNNVGAFNATVSGFQLKATSGGQNAYWLAVGF